MNKSLCGKCHAPLSGTTLRAKRLGMEKQGKFLIGDAKLNGKLMR